MLTFQPGFCFRSMLGSTTNLAQLKPRMQHVAATVERLAKLEQEANRLNTPVKTD